MRRVQGFRARVRADSRLVRVGLIASLAALVIGLAALGLGERAPTASVGDTAAAAAVATATAASSFAPVADARLEEAAPATNYGTATRLGSDGDAGLHIQSVVRFDVTGLTGAVSSAKLRLYVVSDGTVDGPAVYPAEGTWTETGVTWATKPAATGPAAADMAAADAGTWVELDVTQLVTGDGPVNLLLGQEGTDGVSIYSRQGSYPPQLVVTTSDAQPPPPPPPPPPDSGEVVVMAAGDVACQAGSSITATKCRHQATSELLLNEPNLAAVLALGDLQYEDGTLSEFTAPGAYDDSWGRLKAITKPVPGNHEYHVAGAPGYYDYFGGAAGERGKGYYSFDLGSWHLIALNSEISHTASSAQVQWLKSDLAAATKPCILAYWHKPRFSSGYHGGSTSRQPLWDALYAAQADVVLNAHEHSYERFAPQSPTGQAVANGIREFIVGTGGSSLYQFNAPQTNSEVRNNTAFGVLRLTLRVGGYDWRFVPEAGATFTDSGSGVCH